MPQYTATACRGLATPTADPIPDSHFLELVGVQGEYVLCVVFRGKPTFHKIATGPDSELLVNGKKFGSCSTVAALVRQLSTKQKNWPVPLINPVPMPADGGRTEAAGPIAPQPSVVAETETPVAGTEEPVEDELAEAQRLEDERIAAEAAAQQKRDAEEQATAAKAAAAEAEAQEAERQKQQEERRKAKEAEAERKAHAKLIAGATKWPLTTPTRTHQQIRYPSSMMLLCSRGMTLTPWWPPSTTLLTAPGSSRKSPHGPSLARPVRATQASPSARQSRCLFRKLPATVPCKAVCQPVLGRACSSFKR